MTSQSPSTAELQSQIASLEQQLQEARKMGALGELLSTTAHEFNNILMTVINYAKLGMRQQDSASRDKAFRKILSAGQRANKITSSILGMARNRGDSMEPTDLASLIDDVLVLLERELHKYHISVDRQLAEVPDVLVCGNQIQQVLLNLIINARQAMPGGGTLVIRLSDSKESGMVDLWIRDTGTGIPAEQLPRIFDTFYSTKDGPDESGKGGTGLGLSTCREIIEAHRGRIRVESTIGKGTAFTLRLPKAKRSAPSSVPPPVLGIPTSNKSPTSNTAPSENA